MDQKFLTGKQIYLRALEEEDLDGEYINWINNPKITRFMSTGIFPQTKKMLRNFYESASSDKNAVYFAIVDKKTNKHVGNTQIYKIDWRNRICEFGILIGEKKFWGKGLCKEVLGLLMGYVFGKLNLRKMCINVIKENIGAVKCYAGLGFKQEAEQKEMWYDAETDTYVNNLWFGLTKDEYVKMKEG